MNRFGTVIFIAKKSLRQHLLSTIITSFSIALAGGLLISVFSIKDQCYSAFTGGATGFDAVLGARGSQLQLVLNSVFHLETSTGNIPWSLYSTIKKDPRVSLAIPYAVGDNYQGYRIVGTSEEIFDRYRYRKDRKLVFAEGKAFDPKSREAVIGSFVAQKTGLKLGDHFNSYHGVVYDEKMRHPEEFRVVGILGPTSTPNDRVIWIPIEAVYRLEGHVLQGSGKEYRAKENEEIPDDVKEVSAVMLKFKNPQAGFLLDQTVNRQGKAATLAWPIGRIMADLFGRIGWMNKVLSVLAYLIAFVAAGSLLSSIYNTINERKREFAILRALGATRAIIFSVIVVESSCIAFLGSLGGYLIYALLLAGSSMIVRVQTGVVLDLFYFHPVMLLMPFGMTLLGMLSGILPAIRAYRTEVASFLVPQS